MKIQSMFQKDIDRPINGVVKVMQDDQQSLKDELSEYIITKELRRHFATFFDNYVNLALSLNELKTSLQLTCDLTRKISIQAVGGIYRYGKTDFRKICCFAAQKQSPQHPRDFCRRGHDDQQVHPQQP